MAQVSDIIYCCTAADRSICKSAGAEILSAMGYDFSSWKDEETQNVRHTLYFASKKESEDALNTLKAKAASWKEFGVVLEDFALAELRKEDWAESWKIHFKPMVISPRLAIAPSWSHYQAAEGQKLVILDPGMSFGTGQHATTKFCLSAIDRFAEEFRQQGKSFRMLDAGSGSGILSISAFKLGAAEVESFDIDPDTLEVAKENAMINGIPEEKYPVTAASLMGFCLRHEFEIVAANILSSALLEGKEKLLSCCMNNGYLILAGILHTEYENVRQAFEATGKCTQLFSFQEKEWHGGAFRVHK